MVSTRFKNRGEECFGCSLANYFDLIGENTLAEKVYGDFRKHPFFREGVWGPLTTRLVSDLTLGKYKGRLFSRDPSFFCSSYEETLRKYLGVHASAAIKVIEEEKNSGRITLGLDEFLWEEKALLFVGNHALLYCSKGKIVDNGEVRTVRRKDKNFYSSITGVLRVYRAPLDFTDLNVLLEEVLHVLGNNNSPLETSNT